MTPEEYSLLFHRAQVNLVAFKQVFHCDDELRKMVEMAVTAYTTPPQRKPLTDEQIKDVATSCMWWVREQDILDDAIELARAIEAAHGIKE